MQILLSRVEAQGSSICRVMAIAACVVIVCAGAVLAQSIAGQYRVEGRNPDGSVYDGSVRIADNDGAIAMTWSVESHSYQGTGTRNQDVIWVDWGDQYPVVYVRMPDGALHGTWTNGRAVERLLP